MGLIDAVVATVKGFFACRHPAPVARVELIPDLEYVRYYWMCEECGEEWEQE